MQEEITRCAIVEYEYDLEYLLAAVEVLSPYDVNPKIGQVYSEEFKEKVFKLLSSGIALADNTKNDIDQLIDAISEL